MTSFNDPPSVGSSSQRSASLTEWQRVWGGSARTIAAPRPASVPDAASVQSASVTVAPPIQLVSIATPGSTIDRVAATRAYREN